MTTSGSDARTTFLVRPAGLSGLTLMRSTDRAICRAYHVTYTVCVVYAGACSWRYRGRSWEVDSTRPLMLMEPGEHHVTTHTAAGPVRFSVFLIEPEVVQAFAAEAGRGPLHVDNRHADNLGVASRFADLEAALGTRATNSSGVDLRFSECVSALLSGCGERADPTRSNPPCPGTVAAAIEYLHDNIAVPVRGEELAGAIGVSRPHLLRSFKAAMGISLHEYHNQIRLAHAIQRLGRGHQIRDVADGLGFADQSHLNRVLLRHYRVTPGAVRPSL